MLEVKITGMKLLDDPITGLARDGIPKLTSRTIKRRQAHMARFLVHDLATTSPRRTGRFQASWMATINREARIEEVPPKTDIIDNYHPDFGRQVGELRGYATSAGKPQRVVVTNPLPYWQFLEYESRHAGFIQAALNRAIADARVTVDIFGYGWGGKKSVTKILAGL